MQICVFGKFLPLTDCRLNVSLKLTVDWLLLTDSL